jgi:hypothetical protein
MQVLGVNSIIEYMSDISESNSKLYSNASEIHDTKWICEYEGCLKRYSTQGNLKTHQKTHNGNS